MSKHLVYIILILLGATIAYIILGDAFRSDINKQNPYVYDLEEFKRVDPEMVKYREVKRIAVSFSNPRALDYYQGYLGIAYENTLQVIDTSGRELFNKILDGPITGISFNPDGNIFLGCKDHLKVFDLKGDIVKEWMVIDSSSFITSIAFKDNLVFIADAGGPAVHRFTGEGEKLDSFDGTGRIDSKVGFIVPSPHFDLAVDPDNQLWVANTGLQAIENYTDDGIFRSYWGRPSFTLDGFTGCCNPAQFSILSDGSFVTCEKGIVRIKVYYPSGELESVVAPPKDFNPTSEPADLTVDENDSIYALDISRNMIRKFERKKTDG